MNKSPEELGKPAGRQADEADEAEQADPPDSDESEDDSELLLSPLLVELLVCPVSGGRLSYDEARCLLISSNSRLCYPVKNGIPILLPSEADEL